MFATQQYALPPYLLPSPSETAPQNFNAKPAIGHVRIIAECLLWLGAFYWLSFAEETPKWAQTIMIAMVAVYCGWLFLLGNCRIAATFTLVPAAIIWGVSWAKSTYLNSPFEIWDIVYLSSAIRSVVYLYWHVFAYAGIAIVAIAASLIITYKMNRHRISLALRVLSIGLCVIMLNQTILHVYAASYWSGNVEEKRSFLGTFARSVWMYTKFGPKHVTMFEVGDNPLPSDSPDIVPPNEIPTSEIPTSQTPTSEIPTSQATISQQPDIVMVLGESVYDPRIFGQPVESVVSNFFSPPQALSGMLKVPVYGGSTWVSEFAALTGISPETFGDGMNAIPILLEDRMEHSLLTHVKTLGYQTVSVLVTNGRFMNDGAFQLTLGSENVDTLPAAELELRIRRDRYFYDKLLANIDKLREQSGKPIFAYVKTIFNHGPHGDWGEDLTSPNSYPDAAKYLAKNASGDHLNAFRDYYMRLRASVDDIDWLKNELTARSDERPFVMAWFGDHHPGFTRSLAQRNPEFGAEKIFHTNFFIEGFGTQVSQGAHDAMRDIELLDISYLPTLLLQAAGLPGDAIYNARKELMARCEGKYAGCDDPLKGQINRTLVQDGLIDVDATSPLPASYRMRY